MMEQLEEFLLMDDDVEGGVLDPFWLLGGSSSVHIDGTHEDDEWWINHDNDGFILKEIDDGFLFHSDIPSIPSILSTDDQDESIYHNHQEAAELLLIDNYFTNTEQEHHNSITNVVTDDHHHQQQQQQQQQHAYELEKDEEEEEEEEIMVDQAEMGSDCSKNLVSERNRRKRLNTQLFTLRSIVPNITKMDKRSILVDALAYLQSILQQTEAEMEKINSSPVDQEPADSSPMTSSLSSSIVENIVMEAPPPPPPYERCAALPAISKIEVEKLDDERFVLKIAYNKALGARRILAAGRNFILRLTCQVLIGGKKIDRTPKNNQKKKTNLRTNEISPRRPQDGLCPAVRRTQVFSLGAMGQVQRSIEMLGLEITSISVYEHDEHHMETMNFLRVIKKKGLLLVLTEEDLLHKVQKTAKQLGLLFVSD